MAIIGENQSYSNTDMLPDTDQIPWYSDTMSTRVTTTILLILLVLVSAASGVYHLKSREEIEALQQRITELTREQSLSGTQTSDQNTEVLREE